MIYSANEVAGFYIKCNTGLKWVKPLTNDVHVIRNFSGDQLAGFYIMETSSADVRC